MRTTCRCVWYFSLFRYGRRKVAVSYKLTRYIYIYVYVYMSTWIYDYWQRDEWYTDLDVCDDAYIYIFGVEYVCIWVHMEVYSCDCALNEYLSRGPIVCFLLQEPREARRWDWRSSRSDSGTRPVGDVHIVIEKIFFCPVNNVWGTTHVYIGR